MKLNLKLVPIYLCGEEVAEEESREELPCSGIYRDTDAHICTHWTQKNMHLTGSCGRIFSCLNGSNYSFKDCQHCTLWWTNCDGNSVIFNGHTLNNEPVGERFSRQIAAHVVKVDYANVRCREVVMSREVGVSCIPLYNEGTFPKMLPLLFHNGKGGVC